MINNNPPTQHIQHPSTINNYIRYGWGLVPIPPGTKGPQHKGWNLKENLLTSSVQLPTGYGIGLAHAYSGTMALDIDDWNTAYIELKRNRIDLNELYQAEDAVIIHSGKQGHGKLLYKMPFGLILPSKKLITTDETGKKHNYLDFRCATKNGKTCQDVLPPSIHPETMQPYRWDGGGKWDKLPIIPTPLLNYWMSLLKQPEKTDSTVVNASDVDAAEIRDALVSISPEIDRNHWIQVGMALHWWGVNTKSENYAFDLWDKWSSQSKTKYKGSNDLQTAWRSFTLSDNPITIATLFQMAISVGWVRKVDASDLFSAARGNLSKKPIVDPNTMLYPKLPDVDLSLFPETLKRRCEELVKSIGCDPLVPLFSGLAAVCGAANCNIELELLPRYRVKPILWLLAIGEPSKKKTPAADPMVEILSKIEEEDEPNYKKRLEQWKAAEIRHDVAHAAFQAYHKENSEPLANEVQPTIPDLPPPPSRLRLKVSDITSQKLVRLAADSGKGLLCHLDETAHWIRKLTTINSGEDRSAWVRGFTGGTYEMDRVGAGSIRCKSFGISIYGNIQPQIFRDNIRNMGRDGLAQRFLPAVLTREQEVGEEIPDELTNIAEYEAMIRQIYALPPMRYTLSTDAKALFKEFQHWYVRQMRDEELVKSAEMYRETFGKAEGTIGRLALVMHLMSAPYSLQLPKKTLSNAISFYKNYCIPAIRHAYDTVGGVIDDSLDAWMMQHVMYNSDQEQLRMRDIKHSARVKLKNLGVTNHFHAEEAIKNAMMTLEAANWVSLIQDDKRSTVWLVNPMLKEQFEDYREKVIKAKQRIFDSVHTHAVSKGSTAERRIAKGYDPKWEEDIAF